LRQSARQLEQGKRVAARLDDDAVLQPLVQREGHRCRKQRAGVVVAKSFDHELRESRELLAARS
jgi:hypothetical protein